MKTKNSSCYAATLKEWRDKQGRDTHSLLFDIGQCSVLHPSLLTHTAIHRLWQNGLLH